MNISENILKHNLRNVYFLTGTCLAGKTTMAKALSEKYGLYRHSDNYHDDSFLEFRSICNEKYQPLSTRKRETVDWEKYFSRSVDEFLAERQGRSENDEYIEYLLIDLIKLSRDRKVITDACIPAGLLHELSEPDRIACLLASPELVNCENYGARDDHRDFLECIKSLKSPEKKIAVQDELFRIGVEEEYANAARYGFFTIIRTQNSTVPDTLSQLEKHFGFVSCGIEG